MLRFILRRLLVAIPTIFVVITVAFFMMRAAPGSPYSIQRKLPPEIEENLKKKYHFDEPLIVQYGRYLSQVAVGDFGPSMKYEGREVVDIIKQAVPTSAKIGLTALFLSLIIGIGLGIIAALRQNRFADYFASTIAVIGVCVPTFVTGPLLVLIFATNLGWLPTAGIGAGLKSFVLPVIVLTLPAIAGLARLTRASMIEVLNSNFIRTARAKGLSGSTVVFRHALKPALVPLMGYLGPATAGVITGSLIVDKLFRLPGLGKIFFTAGIQRDYTLVMAIVILSAVLILVFNLLADIAQALMDPRVRLT